MAKGCVETNQRSRRKHEVKKLKQKGPKFGYKNIGIPLSAFRNIGGLERFRRRSIAQKRVEEQKLESKNTEVWS